MCVSQSFHANGVPASIASLEGDFKIAFLVVKDFRILPTVAAKLRVVDRRGGYRGVSFSDEIITYVYINKKDININKENEKFKQIIIALYPSIQFTPLNISICSSTKTENVEHENPLNEEETLTDYAGNNWKQSNHTLRRWGVIK